MRARGDGTTLSTHYGDPSGTLRVPTLPCEPTLGFPTNFRYAPGTVAGEAHFTWTAASGAEGYRIQRQESGIWRQVWTGGQVTNATITGVSTRNTVPYRLQAYRGTEDEDSRTLQVNLRLIPQNLEGQSNYHARITLKWGPVPHTLRLKGGYEVEQHRAYFEDGEWQEEWLSLPSGSFGLIRPALNSRTGKIEATVTGLTPTQRYKFRVRSITVHGTSEASTETGRILVIDQRPKNPPTGLTISYIKGQRDVILTWNDDSVGATGYEVVVSPSVPGANLTNIQSFTDAGVRKKRLEIKGTTGAAGRTNTSQEYTFKVYAKNGPVRLQTPATITEDVYWPA